MQRIRLAVIGCGAVTEHLHLPGIAMSRRAEVTALVDPHLERAQRLAARYSVPNVIATHKQLAHDFDAALVTVPNNLHETIAVDLLENGFHVLMEKPMAITSQQCDRMIAAADRNRRLLSVAMVRRLYPSSVYVKNLLTAGVLGDIEHVDVAEGGPYSWPVATDFPFRREKAGGGVLVDTGVHILDLLSWWFGGLIPTAYRDDAEGGVEADCEIHFAAPNGAMIRVDLSRTRSLRNSLVFRGSRATAEIGAFYDPPVTLRLSGGSGAMLSGVVKPPPSAGAVTGGSPILGAFCDQIDEFALAVLGGPSRAVSASDGRAIMSLIETCYAMREPLPGAWFRATAREALAEVTQ
jgi:predicted dehydrogenase